MPYKVMKHPWNVDAIEIVLLKKAFIQPNTFNLNIKSWLDVQHKKSFQNKVLTIFTNVSLPHIIPIPAFRWTSKASTIHICIMILVGISQFT